MLLPFVLAASTFVHRSVSVELMMLGFSALRVYALSGRSTGLGGLVLTLGLVTIAMNGVSS